MSRNKREKSAVSEEERNRKEAYEDERKMSRSRKNRGRYLTWRTDLSRRE